MQLRPLSSLSSTAPSRAAAAPSRLERLAPPGANLEQLEPFYQLGEHQADESLQSSLAWVQGALTTDRGPFGKLPAEDRVELLQVLLKAHPPGRGRPLEAAFPGGELSQLVKEHERFMDANAECLLGEQRYPVPLQQPRRFASLVQLGRDYAGALERIMKSPGRISRSMEPDDCEWALDCVRIEHCHLHREPTRIALFRKLVSAFQDPAIAHVVMSEMESLPADRQDAYLDTLRREMGAMGPFESDWEKTRAEGKKVQGLAAGIQLALEVARPGEDTARLLGELRALGDQDRDRLRRGGTWRGPGQSWAQGMANDPRTGLEIGADRELAEAVCKRARDRGDDHAALLESVRSLGSRLHQSDYRRVFLFALGLEEPLSAALPRATREYELTHQVQGLSPVRDSVSKALAEGVVKGDLDTLMKRFELIYVHRTTEGEARDKALASSLAELLEVAGPGKSGVVQTDQAVWVNGVRLKSRKGATG